MTVDMLAATFFWPEGTLLGSHHPQIEEAEPEPALEGGEARPAEPFWSGLIRHLWRASAAGPSVIVP